MGELQISSWDVSNVKDMDNMLAFTALSVSNYDAILNGWSKLTLNERVKFGAGDIMYCSGEAAREKLINTYGWEINDGGKDPDCEE